MEHVGYVKMQAHKNVDAWMVTFQPTYNSIIITYMLLMSYTSTVQDHLTTFHDDHLSTSLSHTLYIRLINVSKLWFMHIVIPG